MSNWKKITAGGAAILAAGSALLYQTTTATVSWKPTVGQSYRLYYGRTSGQYGNKVDAGTTGSRSVSLRRHTVYYFALTSVSNQVESRKSKEVTYKTR